MICEQLSQILSAPRLLIGAKEAGAGSLLAELLKGTEHQSAVSALLQPPADRYFEQSDCHVEILEGVGPDELAQTARDRIAGLHPDHILVGASAGLTIEKMLIDAGKSAGIPTSSIVDHYWNLWQRFAGSTPSDKWCYCPDTIYVPGEKSVHRLQQLGCPARRIIAFEHPLLRVDSPDENQEKQNAELREPARQKIGVSPHEMLIIFISEYGFADQEGWQWDQPEDRDIFQSAIDLAGLARDISKSEKKTLRLLIRPHPAETHEWEEILPKALQNHVIIDKQLDKSELFAAGDIAFGLNSMLLGEAARAGLPSCSWFPDGHYTGARLAHYEGGVRDMASLGDCRNAMTALM